MHGRLKVKSTAEQLEAKKKEREKKLQLYNGAITKIFEKKKNKELDEELLLLTGEVLVVNPDFYTLWNYRKETFLEFQKTKSNEELQKIFSSELQFLETCLKINPKSYGSWHQRCFVMDNMPDPDWNRELELCNQFLQYDERNFHCWDYRRFVVKRSNVSPEAEFEFSMSKISNNFSNYSSWHYRSKLLPILFPDPSQPMGVSEEALLKEYELVQNGFFTDPDDQSNWFYHRWLMGRGEQKQAVNYFMMSRSEKRVLVSFVKHVQVGKKEHILLECNESNLENLSWHNQEGNNMFSTMWISFHYHIAENVTLPEKTDCCIKLTLFDCDSAVCSSSLQLKQNDCTNQILSLNSSETSRFSQELSAVKAETLQQELESVRQLMELETDNKWALLTSVLLMKSLDPVKYNDEIMNQTDRLQTLDPKRMNYYKDLRSKFAVERCIDSLAPDSSATIILNNQKLTKFYHTELLPFVSTLDLSNNSLRDLKNFSFLQGLTCLDLSSNCIDSCVGLQSLSKLEKLILRNNCILFNKCFLFVFDTHPPPLPMVRVLNQLSDISTAESLQQLKTCLGLTFLDLSGNPVCDSDLSIEGIREMLPSVVITFKEIP
ncbi:geranylgeranyl transferase type-2 subunit alpha-like [Physella acuta]|uniref:geranylgeranyl transferase type-2 subunit alpha-like n=1 Tax=Physella acuta TaxID=109671 RepID=UPI0027DE68E9|nr:geranylgeranyl transferase type-2 subunit alpha-like [Physella acuta]